MPSHMWLGLEQLLPGLGRILTPKFLGTMSIRAFGHLSSV